MLLASLLSFENVPFELAAIRAEVRITGEFLVDKLDVLRTIVLCGLILSKLPLINSSILL